MNNSQSENPKILALILDLDGTLVNTEMETKDILKEFLAKYGKKLEREKEGRRLGMTQKETAVAVINYYNLPITPDQFIEEITPIYRLKWPQVKALPGADRLIRHLHKHGVPFALASNSVREHVEAKISYHPGWKECFSVILGGDEVKEGKPAPYLFEEAAKRMCVPAECCLVIEDSLVGVQAAKAANMTVVAVPSPNEADCAVEADMGLHSLLEFQPELWGLPPFEVIRNDCHGCGSCQSRMGDKVLSPVLYPTAVTPFPSNDGNINKLEQNLCAMLVPIYGHQLWYDIAGAQK